MSSMLCASVPIATGCVQPQDQASRSGIWEGKIIVDELKQEVISTSSKAEPPQCTSLAWSADGQTLFAGYTDNLIRVWQVTIGTR
ncbi:unnamed protein product [Ranitomeya imitator]|uniref:Small ribosomal subunit protein RACK1 n=1 Tax=Ranitomeya imitator TaxID=111125 RepID=A0ABN9MGS3_9NEOB|nr:unnamed protein product [Ranitomeya imitator]